MDLLNVNDASWVNDYYFNDDVTLNVNGFQQGIRDYKLDLFGTTKAVIFNGLNIGDGTNPNTFKLYAGRARDKDGNLIVVPLDIDNIAAVDTAGGDNFIAIQHDWAYTIPRPPHKTGGAAYNTVRSDFYDHDVNAVQQTEAGGWVLLCRAYKLGGVWYYDNEAPLYRSRSSVISSYPMDFSETSIPVAYALMDHNGLSTEMFRASRDLTITGIKAEMSALIPADDVRIDINVDALSIAGALLIPYLCVILAGGTDGTTDFPTVISTISVPPIGVSEGQTIHARCINTGLGAVARDLGVVLRCEPSW